MIRYPSRLAKPRRLVAEPWIAEFEVVIDHDVEDPEAVDTVAQRNPQVCLAAAAQRQRLPGPVDASGEGPVDVERLPSDGGRARYGYQHGLVVVDEVDHDVQVEGTSGVSGDTAELLADRRGALHVVAAFSHDAADLGAFQSQRAGGPCHDAYQDGRPVLVPDAAAEAGRWPGFVPVALEHGVRSVRAVPLRLREQVLGALGLFGPAPGDLNERDIRLAQALADVATISMIQDRIAVDPDAVNEQLQTALDTRVLLEQAKGVLAHSGGLGMPDAYAALVRYARDNNLELGHLARALVERTVPSRLVIDHADRVADRG